MTKLSAGILLYRGSPPSARAPAGASRRTVLGEQGRRRLVDPQGRIRRGRRSARCRQARIRGGARQSSAARRMRGPRRTQTAEPENHLGLRGARRLRSCELAIEPLRAGMAAEERATAILSRGRSRPSGSRSPRREARSSRAKRLLSTGCSSSLPVVVTESCATFRARLPRAEAALAVAPAAGIVHFLPPTPEPMDGRRIGN